MEGKEDKPIKKSKESKIESYNISYKFAII